MALVSLYICQSSDGFIADKQGGISWLPPLSDEAQKNYEDYFGNVDLVIMGSKSYEKVMGFGMGWPYEGKLTYVFSKREEVKTDRDDVKVTNEEPKEFVERIQGNNPEIRKIWLMGGAALTKSFAQANLINEILLFTIPKSIGEGISLGINLEEEFDLKEEVVIGEEDLKLRKYEKKT